MDKRTVRREAKFRAALWIETALAGVEWNRQDLSEEDADKVEAEMLVLVDRLLVQSGRVPRNTPGRPVDDPDQIAMEFS